MACVAAFVALVPAAGAATQCGGAGPWCNGALSPDQRAQLLLEHLNQSQKISLLAGTDVLGLTGAPGHHIGTNAGVPGLVPTMNYTDGTNGIRQGQTTALPDELAVAASFDPEGLKNPKGERRSENQPKAQSWEPGNGSVTLRAPGLGRTEPRRRSDRPNGLGARF
jgi:hypothetical protein